MATRDEWIDRRVGEAQAAVKGTPNEVPDAVAEILKEVLADELQTRLKPEELRGLVKRLAKANNPAAE